MGKQANNSESAVWCDVGRAAFGYVVVCCLGQFSSAAVGYGCGSRHLGLAGPGGVCSVWCVGRQEGWFSEMLTENRATSSFVDFDFFFGLGIILGGLVDFRAEIVAASPLVPSSLWV